MDIYCDFELFNDPDIDLHLFELIIAIKLDVYQKLFPLKEEIEKENGIILIITKPGIWGIRTEGLSNNLFDKVNAIIGKYDCEPIINRILKKGYN
ncbi:MAG: hypothetical protein P4L35_03665 [Ignavibacteriaceae bacterium]|nr:hypothetical protein [Ignavibacteriaceae bacterium]